jgi:ABC-type glycerol-3-phosphate transport system permease component
VLIDENEIYKYNPNSEFYNDICSTYTTKYKTDITLKDINKEFLNNNMTLCENNCNYASYNSILKKVECDCNVKYSIKNLYEIKIDKDKLKSNFNFKNLINIKVLKCYKKVFTKIGFFHNFGNYILLSIIFLYIVSLIYFIFKDYSSLKREIIKTFIPSQKNNDKKNIQFKKNENKNNIFRKQASCNISIKGKFDNKFKKPPTIFKKYKKNHKIISYNRILKKVECICDVKYSIKNLYEIKIDKDKLKSNFNFKNLINIKVLKCYKKLFTKNGLLHNVGSYILLSIIILYIVSMIYLILKDYSSIKNEIKDAFNHLPNKENKNDI